MCINVDRQVDLGIDTCVCTAMVWARPTWLQHRLARLLGHQTAFALTRWGATSPCSGLVRVLARATVDIGMDIEFCFHGLMVLIFGFSSIRFESRTFDGCS